MSLVVVVVQLKVQPEHLEAFKQLTLENARATLREEPGALRFDVVQEVEDPTRFVLYEAYRGPEDHAAHRETAHYKRWRDAAPDMLAEPRTSKRYVNLHPDDDAW